MKKLIGSFLFALAVLSIGQAAEKPNVVLVLVDDMPWFGTPVEQMNGFAGSKTSLRAMPNVEKFAEQGMIFSHAYSPAGMCGPSRGGIQTGMSPARNGFNGNGGSTEYRSPKGALAGASVIEAPNLGEIPADAPTIAERLNELGYQSAHFGKWHVGSGGPEARGYVASHGDTGNNEGSLKTNLPDDPKQMFSITRDAIKFIEKEHDAGNPFYVQLSHYAEHAGNQARAETIEKYKNDSSLKALSQDDLRHALNSGPMVEDLDTTIGMLLAKLDELGIRDNTYIIVTSDNGKGHPNGDDKILRGEKWWLFEGGIRVPFIVDGPGVPAASYCDMNICLYDLLPTFYDIGGGNPNDLSGIDGVSLRPLFEGKKPQEFASRPLYFHYPHFRNALPSSVIIQGDFKLHHFYIQKNHPYLYNLTEDIGEVTNIASQHPEKANQMLDQLNTYLDLVGAQLPKPNPDADPDLPAEQFDPDYVFPPVGMGMTSKERAKIKAKEKKAQQAGEQGDS